MALFTVEEARAHRHKGGKAALESATKFATTDIQAAHDRIKERFEHYCRVAFEPTNETETIDGAGKDVFYLAHRRVTAVASIEIDGELVDSNEYTVKPSGRIKRTKGVWPNGDENIEVVYTHGHETVLLDVKDAALDVCVYELVSSDVSQRGISLTHDFGMERLAAAGPGTPYGLPKVDAVLNERREKEFTALRRSD